MYGCLVVISGGIGLNVEDVAFLVDFEGGVV